MTKFAASKENVEEATNFMSSAANYIAFSKKFFFPYLLQGIKNLTLSTLLGHKIYIARNYDVIKIRLAVF